MVIEELYNYIVHCPIYIVRMTLLFLIPIIFVTDKCGLSHALYLSIMVSRKIRKR